MRRGLTDASSGLAQGLTAPDCQVIVINGQIYLAPHDMCRKSEQADFDQVGRSSHLRILLISQRSRADRCVLRSGTSSDPVRLPGHCDQWADPPSTTHHVLEEPAEFV